MKLAAMLLGALLAATCQRPAPSPTPDPIPYPIPDGGDDTSVPDSPQTDCEVAWSVMVDAECPPPAFHEAWLAKCADLPKPTLDCVMTAESCATMRNCLGAFP